jgi:O-antigen ligase
MKKISHWIHYRIAFIIPFFIFSGFFKQENFNFAKWYLDLTSWLLVFILLIKIVHIDFNKLSIRIYNPIFFLILPMALLIFASILFVEGSSEGNIKIQKVVLILLPTIITCFWAIQSETDWYYLGNGVLALGLYTSIYISINSIASSWGSVSYLLSGSSTALGGLIAADRFCTKSSRKIFYSISFLICSLGVLTSYARGQQLFYIVVLIMIIIYHILLTNDKLINKAIIIISILTFCGLGYLGYIYKTSKEEDIFRRFKSEHLVEASKLRIHLFSEAWELFKQYPLVPAGVGGYVVEIDKHRFTYPHNIILELAAELGIFAVIYISLFIGATFMGYARFRHLSFIRENQFLFAFLLLCSLKQGSIYTSKAFWVWAIIGFSLLGWRNNSHRSIGYITNLPNRLYKNEN